MWKTEPSAKDFEETMSHIIDISKLWANTSNENMFACVVYCVLTQAKNMPKTYTCDQGHQPNSATIWKSLEDFRKKMMIYYWVAGELVDAHILKS